MNNQSLALRASKRKQQRQSVPSEKFNGYDSKYLDAHSRESLDGFSGRGTVDFRGSHPWCVAEAERLVSLAIQDARGDLSETARHSLAYRMAATRLDGLRRGSETRSIGAGTRGGSKECAL